MPQEEIYVVGHTNPDSDSICSAIAYARLRELQGLHNVRPARAGNINRQTQYILDELALPQPELVLDMSPRIGDVISGKAPVSIDFREPLSRAMELFHLHNIRILPVLDAEKKPQGMLYLKKLAERFLVPSQVKDLRRISASPRSICHCLKARFLTEFDTDALEDLNLFVAAMAEESFKEKIKDEDMRRMVLIAGDRQEVLRHVVERGVRVLIVVGGLPVPDDIVQLAQEKQVTILSTAFDTSTSAWLTRLATPVGYLAQSDYITLHEQDRLEQLKGSLMRSPVPGVLVLNDHGELLSVATKSNLFTPSRRKLI
ncbi:MAG: DRTGG domain-containing protein, partial [Desulfuromonadaceae bacterium]